MRPAAALVAVLALGGACSSGPRFRAVRPIKAANADLSVEVTGLEDGLPSPGVALAARAAAPGGVTLRGAALAVPSSAAPCETQHARESVGAPASFGLSAGVIAVDGADTWQRPVSVAGEHRLTLRFPQSIGLPAKLDGALALDLATERAGAPGCLRVTLQQDDGRATWTPVSPWVVGFRLDLYPLGFGLRAGRFVGPVVLGLEDSISSRRSTAAVVAAAHVYEGLGLEASYAGWWELPGSELPSGTFRNGPRLRIFYGQDGAPRFDGRRVQLGGFGVEVGHWWATDSHPADTSVVVGVAAWVNPSVY